MPSFTLMPLGSTFSDISNASGWAAVRRQAAIAITVPLALRAIGLTVGPGVGGEDEFGPGS